jgi:hypothetical protein
LSPLFSDSFPQLLKQFAGSLLSYVFLLVPKLSLFNLVISMHYYLSLWLIDCSCAVLIFVLHTGPGMILLSLTFIQKKKLN